MEASRMLTAVGAERQSCFALFCRARHATSSCRRGRCEPLGSRAGPRFAEPPWNCQSPEWLAIDGKLPEVDLARTIARLVDEELDLDSLFSSYAGRGSLPHRPDLLLKLALYELQEGRPKPAQWFKDHTRNIAIQWLIFGIKVSRSVLYEFRDRAGPLLKELSQQVIRTAIDEKHTDASTGSLDGTFAAANASRHRLVTLKTVEQRLELLNQEIAKDEAEEAAERQPQPAVVTSGEETTEVGVVAEATPAQPETEQTQQPSATPGPAVEPTATKDQPRSFMAKTKRGRKRQRAQYRLAQEILKERNQINARRRKDKRKKSEQVRVAIGDPMAPFGRDKMKVYRPLYNLQTMTDVETDLVFAFSVTPTLSDSGHLVPMIDQTTDATGQPLKAALVDSGYPSGDDLCNARRGTWR